jgi:hypothetical protein
MRDVRPAHQKQIVGIACAYEEPVTRHKLAQFQFIAHPSSGSLQKGYNVRSFGFVHDEF